MDPKIPGFLYEVKNVKQGTQPIQFVHTEFHKVYQKEIIIMDGTTDIELLEVLINRQETLIAEEACEEREIALKRFNLALTKLQDLQARKKKEAESSQLEIQPT